MDDYTNYYSDILTRGLPVLIFAGEYDLHDGPVGIYEWLKNVEYLQQNPNFFSQARQVYFV